MINYAEVNMNIDRYIEKLETMFSEAFKVGTNRKSK